MQVSVAPAGANADLGGLGAVSARDFTTGTFIPLNAPVTVVDAFVVPGFDQAYSIPYRVAIAAGKVLRQGDTYTQPITYTATAILP